MEDDNDILELSNLLINTRIQNEGGNVGCLTVTLFWSKDISDLDLHCITPNDEHIGFDNKVSSCGGCLDIDRNSNWTRMSDEPIENIVWATKPPTGTYHFYVKNFNCRTDETFTDKYRNVPFQVRLQYNNETEWFHGSACEDEEVSCFFKYIH